MEKNKMSEELFEEEEEEVEEVGYDELDDED
jgi:hypothetical protein